MYWLPVIWSILPTDPEKELINLPKDRKINAVTPTLNSWPNNPKKNSGKIIKIEEWGLRNLSHEIKNNKKGYYFHIKLEGEGKTIENLEKAENIDTIMIRYLTVKVKKHNIEENFFDKKTTQNT